MMDECIKLPRGFRFNPFEEELINFYLKPKVLGQKLSCNVVEERQLYGPNANPWQVFDPENHSWILSEIAPGKFEKVTYVFVNLTKKATVEKKIKSGRDNYIKKAGCGTWGGKTSRNEIRDSCTGDIIGEKRMLAFEINEDSNQDLHKVVGYWKMHEYRLCGVNDDISNPGNIVLCKITFDSSKNTPINLHPNISQDHPVKSSKPQNTNGDSASSPSTMNSGIVDGNQGVSENFEEDFTSKTRHDDVIVSDSFRDKRKEGYHGTEIVEICDGVDCINISYLVTESSASEELDTGYSKPVSSDFCWPGKHNNDYQKIMKKAGGRGDLHFDMSKVQFSSYPKLKEEQSVEDTASNLKKRKLKVETSCVMSKKLCPVTVIID